VRGSIVKAVVDKIESYGVFVQVDGVPGKAGRGLVPMADLGVPRGADLRKHFSEGTVVTAKVLETGDGRLRLSLRAVKEDEERANYEGYQRGARTSQKLGTFADLLAKKLGK
jgi:small subunit ribosomal protein S1